MASINATTSSGIVATADNTATLQLQTAGTNALNIDASQNVGIGTTSPAVKLDVNGAIYGGKNGTSRGYVSIQSSGDTAHTGYIEFLAPNGTRQGYLGYADVSGSGQFNLWGESSTNALAFATNSTERMRIDSSGYVRVNNTSGIDGQFSSVAGSWYAGAFANTDATYATVYSWNRATSGNNLFMQFYTETAGALRGSIDYNRAGNAVRYNTSSDERLKENIVDAPSAIDLINSVKIRSFDWKETGFHVDYGVIAQELNEVVPDAVSEGLDNEDGTIKQAWGVDTSVLVPALVKAIQEQQTIINELKARIETLENK